MVAVYQHLEIVGACIKMDGSGYRCLIACQGCLIPPIPRAVYLNRRDNNYLTGLRGDSTDFITYIRRVECNINRIFPILRNSQLVVACRPFSLSIIMILHHFELYISGQKFTICFGQFIHTAIQYHLIGSIIHIPVTSECRFRTGYRIYRRRFRREVTLETMRFCRIER